MLQILLKFCGDSPLLRASSEILIFIFSQSFQTISDVVIFIINCIAAKHNPLFLYTYNNFPTKKGIPQAHLNLQDASIPHLSIHFYLHTRLKFHCYFLIRNGYLFHQPSNWLFIILYRYIFLFLQKSQQTN